MASVHPAVQAVTDAIQARSTKTRAAYLRLMHEAKVQGRERYGLSCGNQAHGFAACPKTDKDALRSGDKPNIAIISAYNDLLSAHQPYEFYPAFLREQIRAHGGVAQMAAGVPAMCDGITQGQPGMELSLLSRDTIALSAAIGLSHHLFDGALMLGICDKIVPGLLIAALRFGHLPIAFVPAGPMPTGISNQEKARVRQLYAEGKVGKDALLEVEAASYHAPGTCTFYGTANSNQLLVEIMGLHLPGASFVQPNTALREALNRHMAKTIVECAKTQQQSLCDIINEKAIVNAMVGLLASGGSTNHTIHLVAIARAAGIQINWDDFAALSAITPLLCQLYPNGDADINAFQRAGGMDFLISTLLQAGLLHEDVLTIVGQGLTNYTKRPVLDEHHVLTWQDGRSQSLDATVLRPATEPFQPTGGIKVLQGNLGRAIFKASAVKPAHWRVAAKARVFHSQEAVERAFKAQELYCDVVVVVTHQGPKACGMPELHKLTPLLGAIQARGFQVALLTDGRMSGASGKVPAAIHVTPEVSENAILAAVQDNDWIELDAEAGIMQWTPCANRVAEQATNATPPQAFGYGRELFFGLRTSLGSAEEGACALLADLDVKEAE